MDLLIDSNVLLDVLQIRQPHYKDSYFIWILCEKKYATGYVSALTFANIVYIMRKEVQYDEVDQLLQKLSRAFTITDLKLSDIAVASTMKWKDFEDAIQAATAERIKADFIITRNIKDFDFNDSKVKAITPEEFIVKLNL